MLAQINSPDDIKKLSQKELASLAAEIRREIIDTVGKNGGHLASNLGVVELTLALHRAFNSPKDAIVFDVSHQCYAHKLLTGRYKKFSSLRQGGGISGFTKECESEHDFFDNGHASTSISQALGLLKARELQGADGKVIAVIGDGALTGGLAYEGLLNAGRDAKNLIVVLNDNQMSISPNEGSLSRYLSSLTMSIQYQTARRAIDKIVSKMPGSRFFQKFIFRFKRGLKGLLLSDNMFVDFGFEYVGPLNGHDMKELERVFERVKKLKKPVVVHALTKKGKGYFPAEDNPELFHGIGPFNIADGSVEKFDAESFTEHFSRAIVRLAERDKKVVAITAAMSKGTGLAAFARHYPDRFFDVGIAEEHAVTFAAGLSKGGLLPVVCVYSTFIQRAVDQIIHDICLPNLRAIFVLDRSGAVPNDGETHQGIFDIALLKAVPNLKILAPASAQELNLCLDWAAGQNSAVAIRYPKKSCPSELEPFALPLEEGRGVLVTAEEFAPSLCADFCDEQNGAQKQKDLQNQNGAAYKRVLIAATGSMFSECLVAARSLLLRGVYCDIYSLRFLKPMDFESFFGICKSYDALVLVEDGIKQGGACEEIEAEALRRNFRAVQVLAFGQKFPEQGSREQILENSFLSPNDIQRAALGLLNELQSGTSAGGQK